ncbi:F0F1 ATP synthase subunit delta [Proteus mirabilis]|nr:F0F1 ATP synthase subunit delta [Proteus mirabilis]
MARRLIPHLQKALNKSDSSLYVFQRSSSTLHRPILSQFSSRDYATASGNEKKIKVPLAMYGVSGNYASALYLAAAKVNALDKVETELFDLVEASKKSSTFTMFMKDLSVPKDTRVKAITDVCSHAKFFEITRNFLVVLAENGRLRHLESIAKRLSELTMAHRGSSFFLINNSFRFLLVVEALKYGHLLLFTTYKGLTLVLCLIISHGR